MPSSIKANGNTGNMLREMAGRGGTMTTDARNFPPSRVMRPFSRRGLVELHRAGAGRRRTNVWHLTPKGWDAIGMTPPVPADAQPAA